MSQGKRLRFPYGGTRNGTVISWPARIRDRGGLRSQWHHVVDVAPTVLGGDVAKATRRPSRPRRSWPGSGRANGTEPSGRDRALPGEGPVLYFASSIFLAASTPAFFASAFSPAPISFTSTTTLRMMPVNFVLLGW